MTSIDLDADPHVPAGRSAAEHRKGGRWNFDPKQVELDVAKVSFFVGRANTKSARPGMARSRERLYVGLARVATRPTEFFRIPADRVIELGAQIDI